MPFFILIIRNVQTSERGANIIFQVFRLPDHSTHRAFPSVMTVALSNPGYAAFVPGYGGGSATDFNRLPFFMVY